MSEEKVAQNVEKSRKDSSKLEDKIFLVIILLGMIALLVYILFDLYYEPSEKSLYFTVGSFREDKPLKNIALCRELTKDLHRNQNGYKQQCIKIFSRYLKAIVTEKFERIHSYSCPSYEFQISEPVFVIYGDVLSSVTEKYFSVHKNYKRKLSFWRKRENIFSDLYIDMTENLPIEVVDMRKATEAERNILQRGVNPSICGYFPELSKELDVYLNTPSLKDVMRRLKVEAYPYYFVLSSDFFTMKYRCTFLRIEGTNEFVFFRMSKYRGNIEE